MIKTFLYIKLDQRNCLYTFLFYFLRLSCSYSFSFSASSLFGTQHQLTQPSVKSSALPLRKIPIFQCVAHRQTNFALSWVIPLWDSATAPHPPVKSSTLPLSKMPVFQGVAPRRTIFTSSCVIPLWDSATAHSPSGKELNPSSQEDARFSGRCTSAYNFHFILRHPSLGLSNSSLTLR